MEHMLKISTNANVELFSFRGIQTDCKVVKVHDGDTVTIVMIYNGALTKLNCRWYGLDTPEIRKDSLDAHRARNRLIQLTTNCKISLDDMRNDKQIQEMLDTNNKLIYVKLSDFDKYARTLAILYDGEQIINDIMLQEGYAKEYFGGIKESWL